MPVALRLLHVIGRVFLGFGVPIATSKDLQLLVLYKVSLSAAVVVLKLVAVFAVGLVVVASLFNCDYRIVHCRAEMTRQLKLLASCFGSRQEQQLLPRFRFAKHGFTTKNTDLAELTRQTGLPGYTNADSPQSNSNLRRMRCFIQGIAKIIAKQTQWLQFLLWWFKQPNSHCIWLQIPRIGP